MRSLIYLPLEPSIRKKLLQVSLIKGAQATTAIEGNTLSEDEILAISNGARLPESRKYLEIEVKNVLEALNTIFQNVVGNDSAAFVSCELICNFHRMIGKDLGEHFEAIPGRFRNNNVIVGSYRGPEYKYVSELMERFCDWLKSEFSFENDQEQEFKDSIIEAIVSHIYIAWIHPFGDGNGRTARLLEFYLLLRGGLPNICSHILSNHYNQTRSEYYRQLDKASKTKRLTDFINYATQGLHDGLTDLLWEVQQHQINTSWKNHVFEVFDNRRNLKQPKKNRLRSIALSMELLRPYHAADLKILNIDIAAEYRNLSARTIDRDINELLEIGLIEKAEHNTFTASIGRLVDKLPKLRTVK